MQSIARPFVGIALFVGVLTPFVLSHRGVPAPVFSTTSIKEVHGESLTTVKVTVATPVQDVRPLALQRGVQIDGRLKSAPSGQMVIAANPFEDVWQAPSIGGVNLATGAYEVQEVDIALPAGGVSWVVGRTYNARQETSGAAHRDSNGAQGKNWFQTSQPEIRFYDDATDSKDLVYLFYGADRFAEYKRVNINGNGPSFKGVNGAAGVFLFTDGGGGADTYKLTDQHGNELTFFGFDVHAGAAAGQLWTIVDADGNAAYVGHATTAATAISSGYDGSGRILYAYDTSDRRFTYAYSTLDSVVRLTQVKAETKTGGTWASPTGVATVATVDYGYYTNESYGDPGDLETVTLTTPLTDSGVSHTQKKYYRYYEGSYNASTNSGYTHQLQYVIDYEGVRKFDWSDSNFDDDQFGASNVSLEPYATAYFEYDSSYRIREAWFNGECGCTGASNGTYLFEYETNGSHPATANTYDEEWLTRTVVQRPDTSYMTQYFDEVGQGLSQVITDGDPDGSPSRWVTRVERGSDGCVDKIATPANCTGYTHSTGAITASSSFGLIWEYNRPASGAMAGFVIAKKYREGTSGTLYYDSERSYTQNDLVIIANPNAGETEVIRPVFTDVTRYPQKTSSSSATYLDDHTPAFDGTDKLSLVSLQVAEPAITTGNNGSNSVNSSTRYFRIDGTSSFEKARDGVVTYREYTKGQITEEIDDADTDLTGDFDVSVPGGLSSPSGYHRVTTHAHDPQGRLDLTTHPDGRKIKHYYSKLADGRLVSLTYNDFETTPKFHGPVSYQVTNLLANVEVEATVALTSNESTTALTGHIDESLADPITAMDLGGVVRLTTSLYSESGGTLSESRLYFDVPASGAGTDGTNYDATFYGYDDNGRRTRVKESHGTITRTVYDLHGQVTGRFLGTNDYDFLGGEGSGPDNMVQTEALEYDGGADDGNGYLTERILYIEDSSTGQRVTTYANDAHGRVLLQTNPTAPHAFHKYDNEGRTIATGLFSSTGSIVAGTDDPTTETANRLALSGSYFDEVGQLWKSVRHKIDASDGSDDDTLLHLRWRDAEGRILKEDGPQLTKTFYDRLGRTTNRFVLIEDDDSTYSHVDDVTNDYVAEEYQTVYESEDSDDVLMAVRWDRSYSDFGAPSPTTGALDTNADGDRFLLTLSNWRGKPQITASWYDRLGRVTDEVQYGDYGTAPFDRDPLSVPSRSDTALVTSYSYGTDGELVDTTDPRGLVFHRVFDDSGRVTKEVRNYNAGVNSGNPANPDDNQTVVYEFVDGLRTLIRADMPSGEDDQDTVYIYGSVAGTPAAMKISTGHLLRAVKYPDTSNGGTTISAIASDSTDVVSHAYNAQGREAYRKDQAGNVFETDYDDSGRQIHCRVTTLAGGFDGAVRRQSWTYDSLGRPSLVTQYDNAAVGSGSVTDEVSYTYDGWGGVTSYKQDKDSAVGGSGFYEMAYAYEKEVDGRNTIRRSSMTLPGSRTITIDYTINKDDSISRVSKLKDGATVLVKYDYLGAGRVVGTAYSEPNISRRNYNTAVIGDFGGYLDRFNRIIKDRWLTDATNPDINFYEVDISYDRNSNITWVEDNVHTGFDVKYTMDDLDRLIDAEEGARSGGSITSRTRHQTWTTLDHVGNWDRSKLDLDGDDNWNETNEYDDTRTNNKVNELVTRDTDSNASVNYTLTYDAAGNLTDDAEAYEYEYDAFYRLRKVKNQSSTVLAEYRYNGLGHMIMVHEDTDVDGDADGSDVKFYPAYDEGWQEVARYREGDSAPKEQFVYAMAGLEGEGESRFINDVVCRNRDFNTGWTTASDGTLEERYYYCPNAGGDISAMVEVGRYLAQWVKYSPHGIPFGMPGADTNSDGDCDGPGTGTDTAQIQAWINTSAYDIRGDVDLDGDVDGTDKTIALGPPINGSALGWGQYSVTAINNRFAYKQHVRDNHGHGFVRAHCYSIPLARLMSRGSSPLVEALPIDQQPNVTMPIQGGLSDYECPLCMASSGREHIATFAGHRISTSTSLGEGTCEFGVFLNFLEFCRPKVKCTYTVFVFAARYANPVAYVGNMSVPAPTSGEVQCGGSATVAMSVTFNLLFGGSLTHTWSQNIRCAPCHRSGTVFVE